MKQQEVTLRFPSLTPEFLPMYTGIAWVERRPLRETGFERNLNSSLPLGRVTIKLCCPGQVLVCSFKDLVGRWLADPLPIEQVIMKSYLPRRRIYFSWTSRCNFFRALRKCLAKNTTQGLHSQDLNLGSVDLLQYTINPPRHP